MEKRPAIRALCGYRVGFPGSNGYPDESCWKSSGWGRPAPLDCAGVKQADTLILVASMVLDFECIHTSLQRLRTSDLQSETEGNSAPPSGTPPPADLPF